MSKFLKKMVCVMLIITCICLINVSVYAQEVNFKDVTESRWHYKDLVAMYNREIISGFPDLTFRANQNLTENQLIKMIAVVLNENKTYNEKGKFWIYPYIKNIVEMGIIDSSDYIENSYNNFITREDVALMIDKSIKLGLVEPIEDKVIEEADIKTKIKDYAVIKEEYYQLMATYGARVYSGWDASSTPYFDSTDMTARLTWNITSLNSKDTECGYFSM